MKIINNINFNKKQIKNAVVEQIDGTPSSPVQGQIWYNTGVTTPADKGLFIYHNSAVYKLNDQVMTPQQILDALKTVDTDTSGLNADTLDSQQGSWYLARGNHTGTQTASTISDFDSQVRTSRLDQMAAPTASVSFNSQKITGLGAPTANSTDAATTQYVDDKVAAYVRGLDPKESVDRVAETPITLVGQNIVNDDGFFYATGMHVLVTAQATAANNGIYVVGAGGWARRADAVPGTTLTNGAYTFENGTGKGYVFTGSEWKRFDERTVVSAGTGIVVSTSGTTATVSIDTSYVPKRAKVLIGNGTDTQFTLTHGFGTEDVIVGIREVATGELVFADVTVLNNAQIRIDFDTAPANNAYGVVTIG